MYLINTDQNSISKLTEKTFTELGFKERQHLQEWLAKKPDALGEELLIIQKEFNGFFDTNERLDLLALDKQGDIVIIENKLDDSGKDVTWQALKYASYCSGLTKSEIKEIYQKYLDKNHHGTEAEDMLSAFFGDVEYEEIALNTGNTQRIMMVAGNFRKEVTSTVLWLMNFKIRIQCFVASIEEHEEFQFLDIRQVLPLPNSEDFAVGMASKTQDEVAIKKKKSELNQKRFEFWDSFLDVVRGKISAYKNISPSEYNWIGVPSPIPRVYHTIWLSKNSMGIKLYIDRGKETRDENRAILESLLGEKDVIEKEFGDSLIWNNDPRYRAVTVGAKIDGGYDDIENWENIFKNCSAIANKMMDVLDPRLEKINKTL